MATQHLCTHLEGIYADVFRIHSLQNLHMITEGSYEKVQQQRACPGAFVAPLRQPSNQFARVMDSFADFIAPVSFVLRSYMDEMALNAARKNRARKEATLKELKVYARMFIDAKSAEIKLCAATVLSRNSCPDFGRANATVRVSPRHCRQTLHLSLGGVWNTPLLLTPALKESPIISSGEKRHIKVST